jgi:uncharacterized membrane protein (Fun14 family)
VIGEAITGAMTALEQSALGEAARGAGWLYPLANMAHVLGAALLLGAIATFDIHVLRRAASVRVVARAVIPIATLGLVVQAASGLVLLSADAMPVVVNPAFQFKMAMLALGLLNVALFRWRFGTALKKDTPLDGAYGLAAVSLASWTLVLLAGRFIAYL